MTKKKGNANLENSNFLEEVLQENMQQMYDGMVEYCDNCLALYYAGRIEETLVRNKALEDDQPLDRESGWEETDIYYDSVHNRIIFIPQKTQNIYLLILYENYDRYEINMGWRDESLKNLNVSSLNWLGQVPIDYDVEGVYKIPELTDSDRKVLNELIDYIYEEFSMRQEYFNYDVYIGDYCRGEIEGKESILLSLAFIGNNNYYIGAELTKEEEGYDIWLYPSPFGLPDETILDEKNSSVWEYRINAIVSVNEYLCHIEK